MSAEEKAEIILPAPIGARFAALLIDWILVNIVAQPLILGAEIFNNVSAATSGVSGSTEVFDLAFPLLINFAIGAVYYGYFYTQKGASLGKMFLGIEVMSYKRYGQRLTVTEAVPRDTILKFLSALFLGIGYLIALLRSDHRAMHDLTVGSVVIKRAPAEEETPSS